MMWPQSGHFTHKPSGTRLGFSLVAAAIGFFAFLNQAMNAQLSSFRARHVVAGAGTHRANLLDQVVERFVARVGVELRGLDHQQRRGVVVEEEMMVRLV